MTGEAWAFWAMGAVMGWWSDWRSGRAGNSPAGKGAREAAARLAAEEAAEERSKLEDSLAHACLDKKWEEAAALIAAGATGSGEASRHSALFWVACGEGPLDLAKALLHARDASFQERQGQTPLMAAACHGNIAMAELLLASGEVDHVDFWGSAALVYAAANGHGEMASLLLSAGAEATERALKMAAFSGSIETAKALLDRAPRSLAATAGLCEAAVMGMTCQVKLRRSGPNPRDIMKFGFDGCPALINPSLPSIHKRCSVEMLRLAISFQEGPEAVADRATALMVAAKAGEEIAVKELCGLGVAHEVGPGGDFALGLAAERGSKQCVRILLSASDGGEKASKQMAIAVAMAAREGQFSCARIIWGEMPNDSRSEVGKEILKRVAARALPPESAEGRDGLALAMMAASEAEAMDISQALMEAIKAGNVKMADALFPLSDPGANAVAAMEDLARWAKGATEPQGVLMSALVTSRARSMMEAQEIERAAIPKSAKDPARMAPRL